MQIEQPSKEALAAFIDKARGGLSRTEWAELMLSGIKQLLSRHPARYRCYGPYWWLIKSIFVLRGDLAFGEESDTEWVDDLTYGDMIYDLAAGVLYEEARFEGTDARDPDHCLYDEHGEPIMFTSQDDDMESR